MKKIVALVLAMVMVLGLATTAFAAKGGVDYDKAVENTGWNFVVTPEDKADDEDATFATYSVTAYAKKDMDSFVPFWDLATQTEIDKDDDFDVEFDGEDEFIKVWSDKASNYKFTLVDGKTITYFGLAEDVNDKGYDDKAVKVTLPVMPLDDKDYKCNTLYAWSAATTTYYVVDNTLYAPADSIAMPRAAYDVVVLSVDGVLVEAVETDIFDGPMIGYWWNTHDYQVKYSDVTHTNGTDKVVTKVYCDNCGAEFKFVEGPKSVANAVFGDGAFMPVFVVLPNEANGTVTYEYVQQGNLWMELVVPAIPGVTGGSAVVTPDADNTVESPKTFDAGIAMYVGMSVMAAAGSAVVLKKKD